jgi:hypothetical protein
MLTMHLLCYYAILCLVLPPIFSVYREIPGKREPMHCGGLVCSSSTETPQLITAIGSIVHLSFLLSATSKVPQYVLLNVQHTHPVINVHYRSCRPLCAKYASSILYRPGHSQATLSSDHATRLSAQSLRPSRPTTCSLP